MTCGLNIGCQLNDWLGGIGHALTGWVPDWFWPLLPYWPWAVVLLALGIAYRFAGWPGVTAVAGAIGFIFGRMTARKPEPDAHEHVPAGPDAAPPVGKPRLGSKQNPIFGKRK